MIVRNEYLLWASIAYLETGQPVELVAELALGTPARDGSRCQIVRVTGYLRSGDLNLKSVLTWETNLTRRGLCKFLDLLRLNPHTPHCKQLVGEITGLLAQDKYARLNYDADARHAWHEGRRSETQKP